MTSFVIEAVGFLAFGLNVLGNYLLTVKSVRGWLVRIASIICWGIYGGTTQSWPMILNAITFFGINCFGYWKWRKDAAKDAWHETQRRAA